MKAALIKDICCPVCHSELELKASTSDGDVVAEGQLHCPHCHETFNIHRRIPNLIPIRQVESHKRDEMEGWVKLWEDKGMYDRPTLEDSFRLPYLDGVWKHVSRAFDMAMAEMSLTGRETILDIGAGQGWASRYFAERGCRAMALDIVADEYYGLGRAWAIMEHAGVYFEPMLGDGENLPFPDLKFDIVFFCGALHHFQNIDRVLRQVYRVLKPGGRIIAAGEPSASVFVRETTLQDSLEETRYGIVERRPKSYQYVRSLERAGFTDIALDVAETYRVSRARVYEWIRSARTNLVASVRPRYRPLVWLAYTLALGLPAPLARRFALYINGGNLLLAAARKPESS